MTTAPAIVPVPFHGDAIDAFELDGKTWISLKRICETLGVDVESQRRKLNAKPWACTVISTVQVGGQNRDITCIDLDTLPMWLATIDIRRVKPECRDKLRVYQCEAARVLADHFYRRVPVEPVQVQVPEPTPTPAAIPTATTPATSSLSQPIPPVPEYLPASYAYHLADVIARHREDEESGPMITVKERMRQLLGDDWHKSGSGRLSWSVTAATDAVTKIAKSIIVNHMRRGMPIYTSADGSLLFPYTLINALDTAIQVWQDLRK